MQRLSATNQINQVTSSAHSNQWILLSLLQAL